jgi:primosomal protein N' (replication factor Y)
VNIAKVIVDVPNSSIDRTFDYIIPEKFKDILVRGMRVIVPFGPRKIMGFVVELVSETNVPKLKSIIEVLDLAPVLTDELIELAGWLAKDTLSLSITALQVMLPQVLKSKYDKEIIRRSDDLPESVNGLFAGRDVIPYEEFEASSISHYQLKKLVDEDELFINYVVKSRITKKQITMIKAGRPVHLLAEAYHDLAKNAEKQKLLLNHFIEHDEPIEKKQLLEQYQTTDASLNALIHKGLLSSYKEVVYRNPYDDQSFEKTSPLKLTEEQETAIQPIYESMAKRQHEMFLLHGVTGSGKTEIYLQAIQKVIEQGKEAIVLVPEISLTPQMVKRFKGRFESKVAVMHSGLSAGEKYDEWLKVQRKEVQVVVGARSAIFAPFENIGIIVIDEEHETSYKQEEQPRYHARDVAAKRGETHQCPVILGSATPTLESYARAAKGVYKLLTLSKRTNEKAMPEVSVVDMRAELHAGNRTMFSRKLIDHLEQCLKKGEQAVLLLNRRGYSTFIMCRDCGHVNECPHCDIALTYHKSSNRLKCHYCSYEEAVPVTCPSCSSDLIRYFGTGTQRIEEALSQLMPQLRVIRMDVDTTRRKGAHEKILKQFANHEADVLLGTQMIAKGLDFENVTLVGVLTADSMLHLPDFRSSEKTFQLLTQVSGRAGRHELPGEVIIQTYTPDHYSIDLASQYDFNTFIQKEMAVRKKFQYPPYYYLALITVSHENQVKVIQTAQTVVQHLIQRVGPETVILGPTPSPIPRIKNRYRFQCMIKYRNEPMLRDYIEQIQHQFEEDINKNDLQMIVDMQPYHLM